MGKRNVGFEGSAVTLYPADMHNSRPLCASVFSGEHTTCTAIIWSVANDATHQHWLHSVSTLQQRVEHAGRHTWRSSHGTRRCESGVNAK